MTNKIFQDPTTQVPRNDPQFVRVPFLGGPIANRPENIKGQPTDANIAHVATKGK